MVGALGGVDAALEVVEGVAVVVVGLGNFKALVRVAGVAD
jgi:hypothetical protein